jgi:ABC-2 type transport system ATP-binding protein
MPTAPTAGLVAENLGKRFGDLWALRGLDLTVPKGSVLGLLGHNGAGKTTALRILTTLSRPTTGRAFVAGADVVKYPWEVRARIGVAAQQSTVDGLISGRANLEMVGRLYHLSPKAARQRAEELLARLDLTDAADRLTKTYSGGMRRRLDLGASLVANPEVIFLDEPTTGLDPRSRNDLWDFLRQLVAEGATVLLTTQYLDEADRLADHIVVLDHGRAVAAGSPAELKAKIGGDRVDVTVTAAHELDSVRAALAPFASADPVVAASGLQITVPLTEGVKFIEVLRAIDQAGADIVDINRRQTTLDDVFLTITDPDAGSHVDSDDAGRDQEARR